MGKPSVPRWVVVELFADARGDGHGKGADATLYPCASEGEADQLVERLHEDHMGAVYDMGGYPDKAWVLDLENPESFGSTDDRVAELDEWDAEFAKHG